MSDDEEIPPMGGGDDFDDDDDVGMTTENKLPDGIEKEILTEAPADHWKKPKKGDEVEVHYVGTLESDGSEFDSSRSRGKPFTFTLGKGQVIQGWDEGVATMKKGEVAKFVLKPDFAYGAEGSPPKIPGNATLIFEVELLGWTSKDDLFGDEGVIKSLVTEGSGWKTPKSGDEVLVSVRATGMDGGVIEERNDVEYIIGSEALGAISKACEKAMLGMKKGEEAALKLSQSYACGEKSPDGAMVSVTLKEIYETKDVSFGKDKSVMKKQVQEGEGYESPKEAAKVSLLVSAASDGKCALEKFQSKTLQFTAMSGEVCDAIECAVAEMKKGEKALLTVTESDAVKEVQLGLADVTSNMVVLTLELLEFEKAKNSWDMSEQEKVEFGVARKEIGSTLFKGGRLWMALSAYKKVGDLLNYTDNFQEENKAKAKELKKLCELNKSACYLKLRDYVEAKKSCNAVLKDESLNVKAIYRRAQAEHGLKNYPECISDCKRIIELDPSNKDARTLHKQAVACQKQEDQKSKGLFANMCKALGKGPIPPPGKIKAPYDEDEMDDVDIPAGDDEAVKNVQETAENADE